MRLLNVRSLKFEEFHRNAPKYVTTSHRWSAGNEAMISDINNLHNTDKTGYKKVEGFARCVRERIGYVDWVWIDTCCVNQDSSQEVDEAVNSMFRWYSDAEICLAYLSDVDNVKDMDQFRSSEWFLRGWTLQELLAPAFVVFLSKDWQVIGCKGKDKFTKSELNGLKGPALEQTIAAVTRVPECVLHDYTQSKRYTTEQKLGWIVGRDTTKIEDMYYSLLGIFDVRMSLSYGEGVVSARQRLLKKIWRRDQQGDHFQSIVKWLSPPDPWINHASARQHHESHTGSWFLKSDQYQRWKEGQTRHLWLYGKAGCGKTILISTIIEDVQLQYKNATNTGLAIFYFSFSDNRKQSFESLLCSLVAQLGWKEPSRSTLQREYDKPNRSLLGPAKLEEILVSSISQYDSVFLLLDAIDECPESEDARRSMLDGLERLTRKASNLKILATSREVRDIHDSMYSLRADFVPISKRPVDDDIGRYVGGELLRDRRLSRLDETLKTLIIKTFAENADGMFRWAYCQLQELKKLKSTKPKFVQAALLSLPATLDATYERMLTGIEEILREEAFVLLRWLAYAQSPLSLGQLAEATIIDPTDAGGVNVDNRGDIEDTLEILSGLVTLENAEHTNEDSNSSEDKDELEVSELHNTDARIASSARQVGRDTKVRLAHFSVKEYLESPRIVQSRAKYFYLEDVREHGFLAQSCLMYLVHYSGSNVKSFTIDDIVAFPLLWYAAQSWFYHSRLQQSAIISREVSLLSSETTKLDWLRVHQPDKTRKRPFEPPEDVGSGFYYASLLGLENVVSMLLEQGADVNAQGGEYVNALQAASSGGHEKVVSMLLEQGADINAQGGKYGNALQGASYGGHEKVVLMLLEQGADINAQGGVFGNALQEASLGGHEKVVSMLLKQGADINAQGGEYGNALQAASFTGHEKVVSMLLEQGADINAQGGRQYSNALQAASSIGHEKIVSMLLEQGADINAQGGLDGNALQEASSGGHEKVVSMLLEQGADINAQGGEYGNALQGASYGGHKKVVSMLLEQGADINAEGGEYGNALQAASVRGHEKVVSMLLEQGANINAQGGEYGNALQAASVRGHEKVVSMLIANGARKEHP